MVWVAGSLLEDQKQAIKLACNHTAPILARVGYTEGPQVTDPFLPLWRNELVAHLHWWDTIIKRKIKDNLAITITPEFGSFPYIDHLPDTNQPVSDHKTLM